MANEFKVKNGIKFPDDTIQTTAATGGGSSSLTIDNKTSAYTIVADDLGKIINCVANIFTVSLTAASTLGAGFNCWIWNTGAGAITIDPDASETIDGLATIILSQGEGVQIVCDGTNWLTGDKKAMRAYSENFLSTTARPIATGNNAVALGESYAGGSRSFAAVIGNSSTSYGATTTGSIILGYYNRSGGNWYATAIGGNDNQVYENYGATLGGWGNAVSAYASVALGGTYGNARHQWKVIGGNRFSSSGDNQWGRMSYRNTITNATPVVLKNDGSNTFTSGANIQGLQTGQLMGFRGLFVAKVSNSAGNDCKIWEVTGACKRGSTYGSAAFVGTPSINIIAYDSGAETWSLTANTVLDNGADGFSFTFTGEEGKTIRVSGYLDTMELTYLS